MADKILVIRFSSLGDVVLTEPVLRALKQQHPRARIALVTKGEYAGAFDGYSGIDAVFVLNKGFEKLASEARDFNPDLIVDLHRNFRSRKLIRRFPNAQKLIYGKARWKRFLKVLTKSRKPVVHTMERYLQTIGVNGSSLFPQLNVLQTENHRRRIEPSGFTIGFGLGARWEPKRWPVAHFAQLAEKLSNSFTVVRFVLFGTEEEYELGNGFRKNFAGAIPAVFVFGQPLDRVKSCLSKLDLLVSNDSGLMHLGGALNVPTLGLFGPTHPVLGFAPQGEKSKGLSLDLYCSPCSLHGKAPCFRSRRYCMEDLKPDRVFEEVKTILNSAKPRRMREPMPAVFLDRDGVIIRERDFDYAPENIEVLPGAGKAVKELESAGFKAVVVSNQSGIGRGLLTVEGVNAVHSIIREKLAREGAEIDRFYFCPHWPDGTIKKFRKECICRKPETGMLDLADSEWGVDFSRSFVIGDRLSDLELGWRKGMRSILVLTGQGGKTKSQLEAMEGKSVVIKADVLEAAEYAASLSKT